MTYDLRKIRQLLHDALTNEQLLDLCFDHPEFREIYNSFNASGNRRQCQRELVEFAERQGITKKILDFVQRENLKTYCDNRPYSNDNVAIEEQSIGDAVVRKSTTDQQLQENANSSHLVITIFWLKAHEKKVLVSAKICYQKAETGKIEQLSLQMDDDESTRELSHFPTTLSTLLALAARHLRQLLSNPFPPKIELYVPVELMSKPLSFWCGQDAEIWRRHSIMIGCSDRYNPKNEEAAQLCTFANSGWHRFQESAPDSVDQCLKSLKWLTSEYAKSKSLNDYAGLQCNGEWLSAEDEALPHWVELVRSGIPLALWNCDGNLQPHEISNIFECLIYGTRLDLVKRIASVRDQQFKRKSIPVGVLFENPDYTPDKPSLTEDQLKWPGA